VTGEAQAHAHASRASAVMGGPCACACACRGHARLPCQSGPGWALHAGDALAVLSAMPDQSADCIVTSPPYWAKRDYGMPGQYGLEPGPGDYISTLRAVFTEARRVLAADGTCWLNLGDSYSAGGACPSGLHAYLGTGLAGRRTPGMAAKNLLGLPWRTALALQDDGWILRNAIVWHKPNAMPESVRDRLNCRHEMIFLLVKSARYWFDLDPIRIPRAAQPSRSGGSKPARDRPPKYGPHTQQVAGAQRYGASRGKRAHPRGRNPGDVWSVPTRPYAGPHYAAYPIDLPLRCIAAGCKRGGTVLDPFAGTGTTGLAALRLGRKFTGVDLNPEFVALAAARLRRTADTSSDDTRSPTVGSCTADGRQETNQKSKR
jgi:DNA modification methylase